MWRAMLPLILEEQVEVFVRTFLPALHCFAKRVAHASNKLAYQFPLLHIFCNPM